jgi:hypothetical protein
MEKTAIEWFAIQLDRIVVTEELIGHLTKEANEMFEQQIKDAYQTSHISMMTAEQYYNEKFKNK